MWWGYYGVHPFFGWLAGPLTLLAVVFLFRLVFWRRRGWYGCGGPWHDGRWEAEAVLQRRLAGGEIDEAEYRRLKEVLRR